MPQRRFTLLLCALSLLCIPALSQQRGTSPSRSLPSIPNPEISRDVRLEIQLVDEYSRAVTVQALVEVSSFGSFNSRSYTNTDGRVQFTVRPGNTYRVKVSGSVSSEEYTFEIMPGEMYHPERITVRHTEQAGTPGAPAGTISASALNIPPKARKEYDKGVEAFRDKKWDKSIEHFEKAFNEYPRFDMALNNLGVAAMKMGDIQRARDAFEKALAVNDRNPSAARNLGRIYLTSENDPARAEQMLKKSLATDPRNPETLTLLAFANLKTGDTEAALSNSRKVHALASDSKDQFPFAHLIAARVLEAKGDKEAAAAEYGTYLSEGDNTADAKIAREGLARLGVPQK